MFFNSKRRRRQQLLAEPFPDAWLEILNRNVRQYRLLARAEQAKLRDRIRIFVAEKNWVGCGGQQIDDEVKVTVAAQACLLVLGIEHEYHYERIRTILVYPENCPDIPRDANRDKAEVVGEYLHHGPIAVSWSSTRDGMPDGGNLVIHEFTHHLDDIDGEMDGTPPLESRAQERRWDDVVTREYHRLIRSAMRGEDTLLDYYGAANRADFFAVATEWFFEHPIALRERHRELYEVLQHFYRQNPAAWPWDRERSRSTDMAQESVDEAAGIEETVRAMRLEPSSADAHFARGVMHAEAGDDLNAVAAFDAALRIAADDGETYQHRATALLRLGRYIEAIDDASTALRLDPDDLEAHRTRVAAYIATQNYNSALNDAEWVIASGSADAEDFRWRGVAKAGLRDVNGAIVDLTRAVRGSANPARAYLDRSRVYENLGMPHEARADREQALRLDPSLGER